MVVAEAAAAEGPVRVRVGGVEDVGVLSRVEGPQGLPRANLLAVAPPRRFRRGNHFLVDQKVGVTETKFLAQGMHFSLTVSCPVLLISPSAIMEAVILAPHPIIVVSLISASRTTTGLLYSVLVRLEGVLSYIMNHTRYDNSRILPFINVDIEYSTVIPIIVPALEVL